jgi:hypothetical protein
MVFETIPEMLFGSRVPPNPRWDIELIEPNFHVL